MKKHYQKKILIIKFGGLGDFILSIDPFYNIRKHHKKENLILLTEKYYYNIAKKTGWFSKIVTINRSLFYFYDKLQIKRKINLSEIKKVYDLQTSKRSSSYFKLFMKYDTEWSGIAQGCSHFHANKDRDKLHTVDRFFDQLKFANITKYQRPKLNWLLQSVDKRKLPDSFGFIVPGGSAKRKYKRISAKTYILIAEKLVEKNIIPLIVGSQDEKNLCRYICEFVPKAINCCNKYNIFQLAYLAQKSRVVIGNDTGPMHLFSKLGNKIFVLFTKYSDPTICAPKGKNVFIYKEEKICNFFKSLERKINCC